MTDDTRDRVIRLETQIAHMDRQVAATAEKVDEMHALLQQSRGARWMLVGLVGLGGFLAGIIGKFTALAAVIPK